MYSPKKILDASNLDCPLPLLKAKLMLAELSSGEILKVKATDPTSWEDFASYARISGNKLLKAEPVSYTHLRAHET